MAIDIASPGANEDALRDALAGRLGLRLLTSGTIASPVAYLDLALPAGYDAFRLQMAGVYFSASDYLAAAFSFDGGATFLNDTDNFDSYRSIGSWAKDQLGSDSLNVIGGTDSLLLDLVEQDTAALLGCSCDLVIYPGSASVLAGLKGDLQSVRINAGPEINWNSVSGLWNVVNELATVTPTPTRATTLRLLPDGNGDANPPTSGETIAAGSYFLWGVPTP